MRRTIWAGLTVVITTVVLAFGLQQTASANYPTPTTHGSIPSTPPSMTQFSIPPSLTTSTTLGTTTTTMGATTTVATTTTAATTTTCPDCTPGQQTVPTTVGTTTTQAVCLNCRNVEIPTTVGNPTTASTNTTVPFTIATTAPSRAVVPPANSPSRAAVVPTQDVPPSTQDTLPATL